ncbi:MAG: hypothetical protein GY805_36750, partial [Chloroflexi bacterium]|nr:hypothetical protein [Chloroflexota bacterium]
MADIFRFHGDAYRQQYHVSREQSIVMRDIMQCRTALLWCGLPPAQNLSRLRSASRRSAYLTCPKSVHHLAQTAVSTSIGWAFLVTQQEAEQRYSFVCKTAVVRPGLAWTAG